MKHEHVGIWVDHRRAVIVRLQEQAEPLVTEINADGIERVHRSDMNVSKPTAESWYRGFFSTVNDRNQRILERQKFFEDVGLLLKQADNVWIFGPGETRQMLLNYLINDGLVRINYDPTEAFTSPATNGQIVSRVREHFTLPCPKIFHVGPGEAGREL